jgi:hypothetical protein
MPAYRRKDDFPTLNKLFGTALLHDDLRRALLKRTTRRHILEAYPLSAKTQEYLLSLDDMPCLGDLAGRLWTDCLAGGSFSD